MQNLLSKQGLLRTKRGNFISKASNIFCPVRANSILNNNLIINEELNPHAVRVIFKCPSHYKNDFSTSHCLMPISVGQAVHEGDKFLATLFSVNQNFGSWDILIDDTLQRHTIEMGKELSKEEAACIAKKEGDLWLQRNWKAFLSILSPDDLNKKVRIMRWNYWLKHPLYDENYKMIKVLYGQNLDYRNAFSDTVNEFVLRYEKRVCNEKDFDEVKVKNLCLDYLFEECTILTLWAEFKYHFEVYPGPRNQAMHATWERFVKPLHPNYLIPVRATFKNRGADSPYYSGSDRDFIDQNKNDLLYSNAT